MDATAVTLLDKIANSQSSELIGQYSALATETMELDRTKALQAIDGLALLAGINYPGIVGLTWAAAQWAQTLTQSEASGLRAVGMTLKLAPEHKDALEVAILIGSEVGDSC